MREQFKKDLSSVFYNTDDFALPAIYNSRQTINGLFDVDYSAVSVGDLNVEAQQYTFSYKSELIEKIEHGDRFEIELKTYEVVEVQFQGIGITIVRLHLCT